MTRTAMIRQAFDPRGRINRAGLLWLAVYLLGLQLALSILLWVGIFPMKGAVSLLANLVFLWISVTAAIKRLHDVGRSAIWILIAIGGCIGISTVTTLALVYAYGLSVLVPGSSGYWLAFGFTLLPMFAMTLWLHLAKGEPHANRFGSVPGPSGFSESPSQTTPNTVAVPAVA